MCGGVQAQNDTPQPHGFSNKTVSARGCRPDSPSALAYPPPLPRWRFVRALRGVEVTECCDREARPKCCFEIKERGRPARRSTGDRG